MQSVSTNADLYEEKEHGAAEFPLEFNIDDTRNYLNQDINWHWHNEFELIYIQEGSVTCQINQAAYTLTAGEGMMINSGALHRFTSDHYGIITNSIFSSVFLAASDSLIYRKYIMPLEKSDKACVVFREDGAWQSRILSLLDTLFAKFSEPERNELWIRNQVSEVWLLMMENLNREELREKETAGGNNAGRVLQIMMQYIQTHYELPITLADIAGAGNISKNTALRYFREQIRISPVEYLIQYRIRMACKMLRETSEKIAYISVCAGYDNISYFNRSFKKYVGKTPMQYRFETETENGSWQEGVDELPKAFANIYGKDGILLK